MEGKRGRRAASSNTGQQNRSIRGNTKEGDEEAKKDTDEPAPTGGATSSGQSKDTRRKGLQPTPKAQLKQRIKDTDDPWATNY